MRAVTHPYPGAFTTWNGTRLYVWQARPLAASPRPELPAGTLLAVHPSLQVQAGSGAVELTCVQAAGAAEGSGTAWAEHAGARAGPRFA